MAYRILDTAPRSAGSDNYRAIEGLIARQQDFSGNSMSAFTTDDGQYVVCSYRTVIATVTDGQAEVIEKNLWGPTTGRHINIARRSL